MWYYKGEEFTEIPEDIIGFVYIITELETGKKYVGQKRFWSTRKLPPLKGKKRRRSVTKESDWRDYFGSSEELKSLVESNGGDKYHREILHLCKSKGAMSYLELKEQVERDVLFRDDYYNEFIGAKIHSKHVSDLRDADL
jgi:hypothetical protein